jgi:hypothetical protein
MMAKMAIILKPRISRLISNNFRLSPLGRFFLDCCGDLLLPVCTVVLRLRLGFGFTLTDSGLLGLAVFSIGVKVWIIQKINEILIDQQTITT